LGYLAAVLEQAGYSVAVVDMDAQGIRGTELEQMVRDRPPRVVGITTMATSYKNGLRIAQIIKNTCPMTKVVMGGPQVTFLIKETLACPAVDIVVRHEGEETLLELMRHFNGDGPSLESIRGIAFRDGGHICQTELRPLVADLDNLPFPARHLFDMGRYNIPGTLLTARGCPSRCIFCVAPALYPDLSYRMHSPQRVVEEIECLVTEYKLNAFIIVDDTFTLQPKRAIEICDLIINRGLNVKWGCEARINTMTPELARKLFEAGCIEVQYGVETGDPEIMQRIRKGIELEQVEEVVRYSLATGMNVVCSFIIGHPWDTRDTVQRTLDFGLKLSKLGAGSSGDSRFCTRVLTFFAPTRPFPEATLLSMLKNWDYAF